MAGSLRNRMLAWVWIAGRIERKLACQPDVEIMPFMGMILSG